jgi:HEAT repeat protein
MLLALLLACDPPVPSFVDRKMIEDAYRRGDNYIICAGLYMEEDSTRGIAAETLATLDSPEPCLCSGMVRAGKWDLPVVRGLQKGTDDAHVGCAATLLDDPKLADRAELVNLLAKVKVPAVEARLMEAARSDADPAVRGAAMAVVRPAKNPEALALVTSALADPEASVRAGAARALVGVDAAAAQLQAAAADPDPGVRAAVLTSLRGMPGVAFADYACSALRKDPDPTVRAAAAAVMKGSKDEALMTCLREHMLTQEDDALVRTAMLGTLRGTSGPAAASILCDAIPFWVHTYIGEDHPEREGPADIIFAQNDRDFNNSYDCVQKALKAGGYRTCEQKFYVNDWFHELGGKNAAPRPCRPLGGASGGGGGGTASNEIAF